MSKKLEQKVKKMSLRDNAGDNRDLAAKVASNMADSPDPVIVAQGALVQNGADGASKAILGEEKADDAAIAATALKNKQTIKNCEIFNAEAVIVQQNNPGNIDLLKTLGYILTSATAEDAKEPEQVQHCTMEQGKYPGTADIKYEGIEGCDYTVEITKGDPSDATSYVPVTQPDPVFSKVNITIVLPAGYAGNILWAKVTAHNTAGGGPPSQPFGGKKIN